MKTMRAKNLQLAGVELVLPTVLCIDGRPAKGPRTTITVGYAAGYADDRLLDVARRDELVSQEPREPAFDERGVDAEIVVRFVIADDTIGVALSRAPLRTDHRRP